MQVLILTVSAGAGHMKASESLKECLEKNIKNNVMIVDTLKYINPLVDKIVVGSYIQAIKTTPAIYGKLYKFAESEDGLIDISKTLNNILAMRLTKLVYDFNADIVVCTHPFPQQMISNLARKGKVKVPIVSVLTDYAPHTFWIHSNIDAYVIPHEDLQYELIKRGVNKELIHPLGIPVSLDFKKEVDEDEIRREFGLEDKLTFLLMGGSLGMGEIKNIFEILCKCPIDVQVICVTGKNKKLREALTKIATDCPQKKSVILSYTDKIPELMSISNLIITKPGGLTVSESMIKGLPIAMISPIPGQEERNAEYLVNSGMAIWLRNKDHYEEDLLQVLNNPLRLRHMSEIARLKAKPKSCEDIASLLENILR